MALWRAMVLKKAVLLTGKTRHGLSDQLSHLLVNADKGMILGAVGKRATVSIEQIKLTKARPEITGRPHHSEEKEDVRRALKNRTFLLKSRVETESGHYLGRVVDFEFDDISWKVERIFVSDRLFFRALTEQLQISREDILFIGRDKVIVRDGLVKRESLIRAASADSEFVGVGSGASLLGK